MIAGAAGDPPYKRGRSMQDDNWKERYTSATSSLHEVRDASGPRFVVSDTGAPNPHYRIAISANAEFGNLCVSIAAEHSDDRPGALANYTPEYEHAGVECAPGEVTIDDQGLLSVLARQPSASHVHIRVGWTALLPEDFVQPIRLAISLAEAALSKPSAD